MKRYTQHKTHVDKTHDKNKKWAIFTFHSPKVRKLQTYLNRQTSIERSKHEHDTATNQTQKLWNDIRPQKKRHIETEV
jgi:hypothetical protein